MTGKKGTVKPLRAKVTLKAEGDVLTLDGKKVVARAWVYENNSWVFRKLTSAEWLQIQEAK